MTFLRRSAFPLGLGLVLAASGAAVPAVSSPPSTPELRVTLVRPLPGSLSDSGVAAVPLDDGLLISGFSDAGGVDSGLLLRVSATGDEIWRRALPSGGDGAIWCLRAIGDGTFAGAGWVKSSAGDLDATLIRFDAAGKVIWQTSYPGPHKERLWSLEVVPQGLLAAGEALEADGTSKALVIRADLDGKEIARVSTGGAPVERVFSIQALADGGYVLAGLSGGGPREGPGYDAKIARYDAAGKPIWSCVWGGPGFDVGHDVRRLEGGGFLATGYTDAGAGRGTDVFLLKLSAEGNVVWSRTYGGPRDDRAVHLALLPGGGAAIAGYAQSASGDWDIVARGTSGDGEELWARRFGGAGNELGRTVAATGDGGLIVVGHSQSYGPLERILLVRLHPGRASR
ncbi:MAG TPA: hypothetical protein VGR67_05075 [Candidatus Polarisedimenticolia bacterium]|nr:hypothetical protein [Candidatus Polarisedimenticolia bacterium]